MKKAAEENDQREPARGFPLARGCLSATRGVAVAVSAMRGRKSSARVAVFIDGLNVMFRLQESGWEEFFDVCYLAKRLARKRPIEGVFYFRSRPSIPPIKTEERYWQEVQHVTRIEADLREHHGRWVRYGWMAKRSWGWQEKRTDVWLASEMVAQAHLNAFDIAILVTADTDLIPAVEHVRMTGKGVELVTFPRCQVNISELVRHCTSTTTARRSFFRPYPER